MAEQPMAQATHQSKSETANPAYFSVWDLHAYYGESYIVQGVSMDIHEGEILALLGRNGPEKPRPCVPSPGWIRPSLPMVKSGWTTSRCIP